MNVAGALFVGGLIALPLWLTCRGARTLARANSLGGTLVRGAVAVPVLVLMGFTLVECFFGEGHCFLERWLVLLPLPTFR